MNGQALSMEEPKRKLMNLEAFIPDDPNNPNESLHLLYDFGRHFADYLNSQLVPTGFVLKCELALHDLQTGVNGFTGKPIRSRLVGYPPIVYSLLRMEIPRLVDAVLPAEFAADVKNYIEQVNIGMRAGQGAK